MPDAIRAEWVAWQLELESLCDKISAAASRLQSRHKRELDRVLEELEERKAREADAYQGVMGQVGPGYSAHKRALNRQVLAMRGQTIPNFMPANGGADEPSAETE